MAVRPAVLTTCVLLSFAAMAFAQGKKPPKAVTIVPATATFRCDTGDNGVSPCTLDEQGIVEAGEDHLRGDGQGGYGGNLGSLTFYYRSALPRTMGLYLRAPSSRECATSTTAGCNPTLANGITFDGGLTELSDFELHIKPLVPGTLEDFVDGPANMGCGSANALPALFHLSVRMPNVEGHWGLNYNRRAYHSTNVLMTRTGDTTWTVETVVDEDANSGTTGEIVSFNHSGIQGKKGPSHEGLFEAPFALTIESDGLPTAHTTCQ